MGNKDDLEWLTNVPAGDGNFKSRVIEASYSDLEKALAMSQSGENKGRRTALERELRKRDKMIKSKTKGPRSPKTGNMRNFGAMGDEKLLDLWSRRKQFKTDRESINELEKVMQNKFGDYALGVIDTLDVVTEVKFGGSKGRKRAKTKTIGLEKTAVERKKSKFSGGQRKKQKARLEAIPIMKANRWALTEKGKTPEKNKGKLASDVSEGGNPAGWWVSEKFDGLRAIWIGIEKLDEAFKDGWITEDSYNYFMENRIGGVVARNPTGVFVSKYGNAYDAPLEFTKKLPSNAILDGELWAGRGKFEMAQSIARTQSGSDGYDPQRWDEIDYLIFDCPSCYNDEKIGMQTRNFEDVQMILRDDVNPGSFRLARKNGSTFTQKPYGMISIAGDGSLQLSGIEGDQQSDYDANVYVPPKEVGSGNIRVVSHQKLPSMVELEGIFNGNFYDGDASEYLVEWRDMAIAKGAEGLMIREPGSAYSPDRSRSIRKVKAKADADAVVIGHYEGSPGSKNEGRLGGLIVENAKGSIFKLGGMTDDERERWEELFPLGTVIEYSYLKETNKGNPSHAAFIRVRPELIPSDLTIEYGSWGKGRARREEAMARLWGTGDFFRKPASKSGPRKLGAHPEGRRYSRKINGMKYNARAVAKSKNDAVMAAKILRSRGVRTRINPLKGGHGLYLNSNDLRRV